MREILREKYISDISKSLLKNRIKIDSLHKKNLSNMSQKQRSKHEADLNFECMHKAMNEERLGYALGHLKLSDLRSFYEPSSFHKYDGIRKSMELIKFI
jgi:hypothetical protein